MTGRARSLTRVIERQGMPAAEGRADSGGTGGDGCLLPPCLGCCGASPGPCSHVHDLGDKERYVVTSVSASKAGIRHLDPYQPSKP